FPAVLDNYVHLHAIRRRQHREPNGSLENETYTDTEHRRFHQQSEWHGGAIRRQIPHRQERTALKDRTVLQLAHQTCPHHPETTTGRSPLEVEHPVKGVFRGPLGLSVVPRKPVSLNVILLDREHALDHSTADVAPRFLTAVLLDTGVRP